MQIQNNQFLSIEQLQDKYFRQEKANPNVQTADGKKFEDILRGIQEQNDKSQVKFSKHATNRLNERHIELTSEQLERLNEGTRKASDKGIVESLVLVDELAFIVNTKNNTVITAMDQTDTKESIFTNIDGAVIS